MRMAGFLVAATMLSSACSSAGNQALPPDAVRVGDDYFMVPVGVDEQGCRQFTPWSSSRPVPTAIYYRKADGEYTLYRSDTNCSGESDALSQ